MDVDYCQDCPYNGVCEILFSLGSCEVGDKCSACAEDLRNNYQMHLIEQSLSNMDVCE